MSEEEQNVLDKFDEVLENYELDKKCGQISIDSICHLFPSEIITIKNYIQQKENIIKEVREYIEDNSTDKYLLKSFDIDVLLEILDKVGDNYNVRERGV